MAIMLLALVIGLGTPATIAAEEGTAESPGIESTQNEEGLGARAEGTAESPGVFGTAESPGFTATFLLYLDVII